MIDRALKVDWFQVIIDLNRSGYTTLAVAQAIGTAKSTVLGWKQGATPRWEDGECLLELWMTITKNCRDGIPVISRYDFRA